MVKVNELIFSQFSSEEQRLVNQNKMDSPYAASRDVMGSSPFSCEEKPSDSKGHLRIHVPKDCLVYMSSQGT